MTSRDTRKKVSRSQRPVLDACRRPDGVTCRELCDEWRVPTGKISGRFTELRGNGRIRVLGVRNNNLIYQEIP